MPTSTSGALPLDRLATGIPGLDTVTGGGLPRGGLYVVEGEPGTGKTILAAQIGFHHVRAGGRALFVTLLAESQARMLLNLGPMAFFDAGAVGEAFAFLSGLQTLEEEGLPGLLALLRREIQAREATLLVIDGLMSGEQRADAPAALAKFLHELQLHAGVLGCTTLLLSLGQTGPQGAVADGVLALKNASLPSHRERRLELTKLRGSASLDGDHVFRIGPAGIEVFPRLEAIYGTPSGDDRCRAPAASTGIPRLDELLGGPGLPCGTTAFVAGPSGSGKTVFGLQFLGMARPDARGVYLTFYETPERALRNAEAVGVDLRRLVQEGTVRMLWTPTTYNSMDDVAHRLLRAVEETDATRVFIDGLDGFLQLAPGPERAVPFFTALGNELRTRGVTTLYTYELRNLFGGVVQTPLTGISAVIETMILLRYFEHHGRVRRVLSITKVRDRGFDQGVREFTIGDQGVAIGDAIRGVSSALTGPPAV